MSKQNIAPRQSSFRTEPDPQSRTWPSGIAFIVGNEGCERFSYYGMGAILYIYVVSLYANAHLAGTQAADMATSTVHLFSAGVYAFPMIGAIVADRLLGKYHTILWLSLVYCMGHFILSMTEGSLTGLYFGLSCIALGSGGIKPCVSANVGDQFGQSNWYLIEKVYQIFYFVINFGSFFATLLIPLLQMWFGWRVAFAVPGILMGIATFIFWLGRHRFVHVPAKPGGKLGLLDALSSTFLFMTVGSLFVTAHQSMWTIIVVSISSLFAGLWFFQVRQSLQADDGFLAVSIAAIKRENLKSRFSDEAIDGTLAVYRIMSVFLMVSIFWALFDQHGSSWIRQAEMMNRHVSLPFLGDFEFLPSQIQSLNPVLVMILIPLISYRVRLSPLARMSLGMLIASLSFVAVALIQWRIDTSSPASVHVAWQLLPYFLITLAEVFVSITGLEFAYTQAPKRMKSTIMGFWLLTVAFGNVLVALTARFSHLKLVNFFWVFAGLMATAAVLFSLRAAFYVRRDYHQ